MKKLNIFSLSICLFFSSCAHFYHSSDNELEEISEDVIKKKEGVDIRVTPVSGSNTSIPIRFCMMDFFVDAKSEKKD